jgi:hypothetical protein
MLMLNRLLLVTLVTATLGGSSVASAQSMTTTGNFTILISKDPQSERNRSYAYSATADSVGGLGWKCLGDGMNVVLAFRGYFREDRGRQILVRYQFNGKEEAAPSYWTLASGGEAAYMPLSEVEEFTEQARGSREVVLHVSDPVDGQTRTFEVPLSKLGSALGRIGKCPPVPR